MTINTTSTTGSKESNLKGGDTTGKEVMVDMTIPRDNYNIYMCNHHGHLSASINEAGTEYTCTICGAKFSTEMPNDTLIDKSIKVLSDIINLAKLCFPKYHMESFSYMIPMMKKLKTIKSIVEQQKINFVLFNLVPTKANTTDPIPTTSTTDSKELNLKGGDATRKEATMATNNTKSEAGELIANFTKNSLGDKLPKEYFVSTGIVEAIPVLSKAIRFALDLALIRAILSGDYPQLLNLERDGNTISNVKAVIAAFTNNKDEVTINDLIKLLKYGSYECHMDEEGRIGATLLYIKLYNK